jgi:hypothetical protein
MKHRKFYDLQREVVRSVGVFNISHNRLPKHEKLG